MKSSIDRGAGFFIVHFSVIGRHGPREQKHIVYKATQREALETLPPEAVVHRVRWRPRTPLDRQWILSQERIGFLRAFSSFINAGETPARALKQTIDLSFGLQPAKRTQMQPALDELAGGGDFVKAAGYTGIFDAPILGLLAAGAQTKIREVIGALQDYLEVRQKLYAMAGSQLGLIAFEFVGAIVTAGGLEVSGFDMFIGLAEQAHNASTAAKADFMASVELCRMLNRVVLLILTGGVGLLLFLYLGLKSSGTPMERLAGKMLTHTPLLNEVAADLGLAETFGIFGRLLKSGIPWQQALKVVQGSAPVGPVGAYWEEVRRLGERTALSGAEILVQARRLLRPWEGYPLLSERGSTPALGAALMQLALDRQESAQRSSRSLVRSVSTAMIMLMTAVIGLVFYLGVVQSQLSMADMNGLFDSNSQPGAATP
jgi:type II secretory pathway component PulF